VRIGGALAPPYDVISDSLREELYGRNLRNIVRIDYGVEYAGDAAGTDDRYTRAESFLHSWLDLGILQRDEQPSLYLSDHEFTHPDGAVIHRNGVFATVPAKPWAQSELRPHERTMTEPKADRLALLRATATQTSPVFGLWQGDAGFASLFDELATGAALLGGRSEGELGSEKHLLWRVDDETKIQAIVAALQPARLYVADGHHRYETAVAYAAERGLNDAQCLVYLASAADPGMVVLPTHRLVKPAPGVAFSLDDLWARLDDSWEVEPSTDVERANATAAGARATHHAFVVLARDGIAVLRRPRSPSLSPRESLDASVLESAILAPAGVSGEAIAAGALAYTRRLDSVAGAVRSGAAVLGFGVQPTTVDEVTAVADAGETMPQKSTYFYPKVPTGLVLYPM
jgi:uncharacterized protein (DUF1015 family)